MSEELRIVVQDPGGGATAPAGAAPRAPSAGGSAGGSGSAKSAAGAGVGAALTTGKVRAITTAALAAVGLSVPAALAVVAGFAAVAISAKLFGKALNTQVKELVGFSQDIAIAAAQSDVLRIQAKVRRADQIGPQLANAERQRARIDDKMFDIWTEMLSVMLGIGEVVNPFVELATESIANLTKWGASGVNQLTKGAADLLEPILRVLTDQLIELGLIEKKDEKKEAPKDPFFEAFFASPSSTGVPLFIPGQGPI